MDDMEGVKEIARLLRAKFGEGVTLRRGTDAEHEQIDAGWPVSIAVPPFHYEQTRVEA
jgi:hypothetical protein